MQSETSQRICVWDVASSPYESPFLKATQAFGESDPVFLIDQFSGKRPLLINEEFATSGTLRLAFFPTALLDSNITDALHRFVRQSTSTDGTMKFLRYIARNRWDYSLHFYYFENFAKANRAVFEHFATEKTESLLTLRSMDDEHFLKTGEIRTNSDAVAHFTSNHSAESLREVAEKQVKEFLDTFAIDPCKETIEAIRIVLMKLVLIDKREMPGKGVEQKFEELLRFMNHDLGIMLALEVNLGLYYFSGAAGRLLGVELNTPFHNAQKVFRSTSWDLFLLRLPELIFMESRDEVCVPYVATSEKRLQAFASLFTVNSIARPSAKALWPLIQFDLAELPGDALKAADAFNATTLTKAAHIGHRQLKVPVGLADALERELRRILP